EFRRVLFRSYWSEPAFRIQRPVSVGTILETKTRSPTCLSTAFPLRVQPTGGRQVVRDLMNLLAPQGDLSRLPHDMTRNRAEPVLAELYFHDGSSFRQACLKYPALNALSVLMEEPR